MRLSNTMATKQVGTLWSPNQGEILRDNGRCLEAQRFASTSWSHQKNVPFRKDGIQRLLLSGWVTSRVGSVVWFCQFQMEEIEFKFFLLSRICTQWMHDCVPYAPFLSLTFMNPKRIHVLWMILLTNANAQPSPTRKQHPGISCILCHPILVLLSFSQTAPGWFWRRWPQKSLHTPPNVVGRKGGLLCSQTSPEGGGAL